MSGCDHGRTNVKWGSCRDLFLKREDRDRVQIGYLTYEAADQVAKAGLGISTAIGIGGDPIIGTPTKEAVELLMNDPGTEGIVMIGEIGGSMEAEAARWMKENNRKPVLVLLPDKPRLRDAEWGMRVPLSAVRTIRRLQK